MLSASLRRLLRFIFRAEKVIVSCVQPGRDCFVLFEVWRRLDYVMVSLEKVALCCVKPGRVSSILGAAIGKVLCF